MDACREELADLGAGLGLALIRFERPRIACRTNQAQAR
jgi:hypothetical protein